MQVLEYLDELKKIMKESSKLPISRKIIVDREECEEIIEKIEDAMPDEIKMAKIVDEGRDQIISDSKREADIMVNNAKAEADKILQYANEEADKILKMARAEAENLISKHKITQLSEERGRELVENANKSAENIKEAAYSYADDILKTLNNNLVDHLNTIQDNRNELKSYQLDK